LGAIPGDHRSDRIESVLFVVARAGAAAPNQAGALYLWYAGTACAGPVRLLTVTAVQPGSGGS